MAIVVVVGAVVNIAAVAEHFPLLGLGEPKIHII